MAGSDEVNSRPVENHENAKIQLTCAELKALVDDAVTKALERQYSEYSGTHSRTLSTLHTKPKTHSESHSKPPSKKDVSKKDDDRHSSNNNNTPPKKIVFDDAPRTKSCTYKYESRSQSQPKACGICKSPDHKALDCKKLKDATCFNCNEKGHLRPNCPKLAKKAEEGKKTNARVFQMNA
ncbi:uncharacterized protein LOC110880765 [Helianthus annuus]|uniref:uncharacterized protein LOC110880765 n=1 Tax=Helianthus annuus TaxID=4232 RepID=UPI000B8F1F32|nr:uncharacterized protein LOC110880765 [Helianthus annuus]